ncbi:NAD-dependent epimerase/dehydratase family protein [Winogradskyella vincentii]|uniref:NAD-dependent epimerase/dehydratase family protein n=1 Tax=Winogradskyella vincentii TaxID=2877122 RepID=A0ABS7Y4I4_9FLAO|nr:NAD-dependent epimerase/dehydratase family protein [Winogradskyella vincentii]MCA0154506.1 NAD-dependent epimerase/dehydratase family protein [Winogradskyella vincentii]
MSKSNSRRTFIKKSAIAGIGIPLMGGILLNCNSGSKKEVTTTTNKKLNILILGGTSFLGPHQIAYALSRGHSVSTFTRGKTIPKIHTELFKDVEQLIGDREDNLKALDNRKWDVVIDNSGRKVEWTKATGNLLKDNVGMYMYTSSTGVYYPYLTDNISTDTKLVLEMPDGLSEDEKYEMEYGVMKANSELEAIKAFGKDRTIVIRPTYMLGPGDRTDRFVHWPVRLAKDGEIVIPGKVDDPVQYIDVRDMADWFIRLAESKTAGTFNGVGPMDKQTMPQFIKEASKTFDTNHSFVQIDDYDFLKENGVYYSIPWVMADKAHHGSARISNTKSIESGLTFRPLKTTVLDTYNWWNSDNVDPNRKTKFNANLETMLIKEKDMLKAWKKHKS